MQFKLCHCNSEITMFGINKKYTLNAVRGHVTILFKIKHAGISTSTYKTYAKTKLHRMWS